jgi:uncharacterized protein (TIGR00369 family)
VRNTLADGAIQETSASVEPLGFERRRTGESTNDDVPAAGVPDCAGLRSEPSADSTRRYCRSVRAPTFDVYDERVASGIISAHRADRTGLDAWLGVQIEEFWPGGLRAVLTVRPELMTPIGNLHGGVLAALCDHVLGVVCYPVMPRGSWAATTEFKLNYLSPVTGGDLIATASIVNLSKRTAVVRVDVDNAARTVCVAQGTVLVMPPKNLDGG